ncbi:hypothetical protein HK096_005051, partial [Nowakowskiella sp. JEL0078]
MSVVQAPVEQPAQQFIDIVGLQISANGRSCSLHEICGELVDEGTILELRNELLDSEAGLAAFNFETNCKVGYLP